MLVGLLLALGGAFALINSIADGGRDYPSLNDVVLGLAAAMLWPVAMVLHEAGHAFTGALVGRPPVWARLGLVPGVCLTPPPVEGWARVLVSSSGPVLEVGVGVLLVWASPGVGGEQFLNDPVAMSGGLCVLNGLSNLSPWPRFTDGGKLWPAVWSLAKRR